MKSTLLSLLLVLATSWNLSAQQANLPNTAIKELNTGKRTSFNQVIKKDKITLVAFWATWCAPCKKEIINIRRKLSDWKSEVDFEFITISVDESRAEGLAKSYAKTQGWDFPHYIDINSDLKRSLNFNTVPFSVIFDESGKVAWSHAGYEEGAENETFRQLKKIAGK